MPPSHPEKDGRFNIGLEFTSEAAQRVATATKDHVGKLIAIVINRQITSAPVLQAPISDSVMISGSFTRQDIQDLLGPFQLHTSGSSWRPVRRRALRIRRWTTRAARSSVSSALSPCQTVSERYFHFAREADRFERVLNEGRKTGIVGPVRVPTTARALIEATNALLPYSLSPQELGDLVEVRRRAVAIADLLVGGLRAAALRQ